MGHALPIAEVAIEKGFGEPLDYAVPTHLQGQIAPGMQVMVPLRTQVRRGIVVALKETSRFSPLQNIAGLSQETPLLSDELLKLALWISKYYASPLWKTLQLFLPPSVRRGMGEQKRLFVTPLLSSPKLAVLCEELRHTHPRRASVLDPLLASPKGLFLSELLKAEGVTKPHIDHLAKEGVIALRTIGIDRSIVADEDFFPTKAKVLIDEQRLALAKITSSLEHNQFATHLLFGVTGSGKTEVYLQAIDLALNQGKGALLLVPEIALTTQTEERLRGRFLQKVAVLHHRLSDGERRDTWHQIASGKLPLVVGARSAVFSPIPRLGLIILDEEHDGSYKQTDETPCYHARSVAVMRGLLSSATVVLGSATPSLESYANGCSGKYILSTLKSRPSAHCLPKVTVVDMRAEFAKAGGFTLFSEPLLKAIDDRAKKGEQAIIFLNRRGFHAAKSCLKCGHTLTCPHCAMSLTFHKGESCLLCHLCGYTLSPPPRACPACQTEDLFKSRGAGTEMVERSLLAIFPKLRILRVDADTTRHKGSHVRLFKQFRSGKADLLIGTQMVAKGHHFPSVTLVGVLHADAALQIPDFRAAENTFQILAQVAGRSGRGDMAGEVIIQTHLPDHPTITAAAAQDYERFYREEMEVRKFFSYPPFTHLVKLTFAGTDLAETTAIAEEVRSRLVTLLPNDIAIHPVLPCGHAKIKDRHRLQFLLRGSRTGPITEAIGRLDLSRNRAIRITVDVDPLSIY